ncbi:MAG: hypothetical protein WAW75_05015 [Gallionella sp.]
MANLTKAEWDAGAGIATETIGADEVPVGKLAFGTVGTATLVSSTNPLPINYTKSSTVIELTTTPLGIAGSYTSATFDHSLNGAFVAHYIYADVDGTHYFEESHDGTTWNISDPEPVTGGVALRENHQSTAKYSRSRYVNGGTAQATFINQAIQKFIGQDEYIKISENGNSITGTKTNNAQGPSTNNLGVLPAIATAAAPSHTEGMQVGISTTLTGDTRVTLDGETVTVASHAVTNAGTFAVQAALNAETTKVIGTVNIAAAQTLATVTTLTGITNALPAGTNLLGKVGIDQTTPGTTNAVQDIAATSGGLSKFHLVSAASTNATNLKSSAGQVYAITAFNLNAAAMYLKLHNTAGTPTAGTGVTDTFLIPGNTAGAGLVINIDKGIVFTTGIGITLVTGITDASAVAVAASEIVLNIYFK